MVNVITLLKHPQPNQEAHGERPFWEEWGPTYLERLVRGLQRWMPQPWTLTVMTDDYVWAMSGLPADLGTVVRFTQLLGDSAGWWAKLNMFRPDVSSGRCLYLDLDNVIGGDLTPLVQLPLEVRRHHDLPPLQQPLWMLDDRVYPRMANGSTILFDADDDLVRELWTFYARHPESTRKRFSVWPDASDQAYIAWFLRSKGLHIPFMQDALPEGYILNSRVELERGADWSKTALVYGSWDPKPHMSSHPFYARHWA